MEIRAANASAKLR